MLGGVGGVLSCAVGLMAHRDGFLERARMYAYLAFGGALLSVIAMECALLTHDFSIAFVAANNSRQTPLLYSLTGLWSALQGSILLWSFILSGSVAISAFYFRRRATDPLVAWALLTSLVVSVFFFALMLGPSNPFIHTAPPIPLDGAGPNVLLQDNPLIAIHPPLLYMGFVGFTIPFSFAIATLITGRVNEQWLVETRRFTVVAWACLTVGIMLGAWWSYQVLGWGGFWGWDPVENAALLPWLTATAYLHSVMVQERRGLLRVWNLSLLIATFSLTILATFLTRSGVTVSVHSFSNSGLGPTLIAFFGFVVVSSVGLIVWRGDALRSTDTIEAPISREGAFFVNNLLFGAFAFVVLLGTVFPLFVQAINGEAVTIGRPFFDAFTVPLGIALLFFMAIGPVLSWRQTDKGVLASRLGLCAWGAVIVVMICVVSGIRGFLPLLAFGLGAFAGLVALRQLGLAVASAHRHGLPFWRGIVGRSNGGMIAHLGIIIIAVGLTAASSFGQQTLRELRIGETTTFDGHSFALVSVVRFKAPNKAGYEAVVRVDHGGLFRPAFSYFNGDTEDVGTPAIDSSFLEDVYLSPYSITPASSSHPATAQMTLIVQPLIVWLWIGGFLTAIGALLAALPRQRGRYEPEHAPSSVATPKEPIGAGTMR